MMHAEWLARGQCGPWTEGMRQVYQGSHIIVGFCYVLIFVMLAVAYVKAREQRLAYDWAVAVGSGVFLTCAVGHFLDGFGSFYWPRYDVFTKWHALTAGFALVFMFSLPWFLVGLLTGEGARHGK